MGIFSKPKDPKQKAWRNYLSWHSVLCLESADKIRTIFFDDKPCIGANTPIYYGEAAPKNIGATFEEKQKEKEKRAREAMDSGYSVRKNESQLIKNENCFGGITKEGGISGALDFMFGLPDQPVNDFLVRTLSHDQSETVSAYRGVTSLVFRDFYIGTTPYLKAMSVMLTRIYRSVGGKKQWYPEKAGIGSQLDLAKAPDPYDMNPAHIIREFITSVNTDWGMAVSEDMIDDTSFKRCADKLYDEQFGLSFIYNTEDSGTRFIENILDHINGFLITDRKTNKWKLKLARNDYDFNSLRVLSYDEIVELETWARTQPVDLINYVTVTYWDRERRKSGEIPVSNNALYNLTGRVNSVNIKYDGVCTMELAQRLAMRELQTRGTALVSLKIKCNRLAFDLEIGEVVRVKMPDDNVSDVAYRITNLTFDEEYNYISVQLIQDIYGYPKSITKGENLTSQKYEYPPQPIGAYLVYELSYYDFVKILGDEQARKIMPTLTSFGVSASRSAQEIAYSVIEKGTSGYLDAGSAQFAQHYKLLNDVDFKGTTLKLTTSPRYYGGETIQIGEERMRVLAVVGNEVKVARALEDTLPTEHKANSFVFTVNNAYYYKRRDLFIDNVLTIKLISETKSKFYDFNRAEEIPVLLKGRQHLPYPPANIMFNGEHTNSKIKIDSAITWSKRHRFYDGDLSWFEDSNNNEPNTKYYFSVIGENGEVIIAKQELTANTHTMSLASSHVGKKVVLSFWSERPPYKSKVYSINTILNFGGAGEIVFNSEVDTWVKDFAPEYLNLFTEHGHKVYYMSNANYFQFPSKTALQKFNFAGKGSYTLTYYTGLFREFNGRYQWGIEFYKGDTVLATIYDENNTLDKDNCGKITSVLSEQHKCILRGAIPAGSDGYKLLIRGLDDVRISQNALALHTITLNVA